MRFPSDIKDLSVLLPQPTIARLSFTKVHMSSDCSKAYFLIIYTLSVGVPFKFDKVHRISL